MLEKISSQFYTTDATDFIFSFLPQTQQVINMLSNLSRSTPLSRHGQEGAETETFQTISNIRSICEKASVPKMSNAAIAWLLGQARISSVIVGASGPEQMVENCNLVKLSRVSEKR